MRKDKVFRGGTTRVFPCYLNSSFPATRAEEKEQMRTRIETHCLVLRPFEPADAEAAFGWFGDPAVMWVTATGPDKSIEETRKRLSQYKNHQRVHGLSKWVNIERDSGVAVGDSGLLVLPE